MRAPALLTRPVAPARSQPAIGTDRPGIRAILRHLALSLLVATVLPTVLFYVCLLVANIWVALIIALAWCYAALAWRLGTRRQTSVLLWLTVVGLTGKTIIAFATGSTFVYFVQPALGDATVSAAFLLSLATATPAVARLAADFYPMTADVAARPRVQKLLWRLTLLWSVICGVKAAATLWMLHAMSLQTFVAAKSVFTPTVATLGAAVTVLLALRVARREGLLPATSGTSALTGLSG
jgi:hypothetical protein